MLVCCLCAGGHHATRCTALDDATRAELARVHRPARRECGTTAGAHRHRRKGQMVCAACLAAEADAARQRRAQRRAAA